MDDFTLNWKGDELKRTIEQNGAKIISEFGLTVEGFAKKELYRANKKKSLDKHGVATGTLRRSIHTALKGYNWSGDDVEPAPGTPELGGKSAIPAAENQMTVQVGSGLKYAMAVNQRLKPHGSFVGYHYMNNGLAKAKAKLPSIIYKYRITK